eukprot:CCRYP_005485-RA/>CCRYP_005485-RA protein AED:0.12 eAED:0.12 QI:44/1/1/1/0/0/2/502/222
MLSSIRNRLRSSCNTAHSNQLSLASSASKHTETAVRPPAILRQGAAPISSNCVHWTDIVTVKPIDLEAAHPKCAKCDRKGCDCIRWGKDTIGGFRVSLVTDMHLSIETRSFLRRMSERFGFGTADHPADSRAPLENSAVALVVPSSNSEVRRRSKLSRRARVSPTLRSEVDQPLQANGDTAVQQRRAVKNDAHSRILKELKCDLDGMYWTAHMRPSCRRSVV